MKKLPDKLLTPYDEKVISAAQGTLFLLVRGLIMIFYVVVAETAKTIFQRSVNQ